MTVMCTISVLLTVTLLVYHTTDISCGEISYICMKQITLPFDGKSLAIFLNLLAPQEADSSEDNCSPVNHSHQEVAVNVDTPRFLV